MLWNFIFHYFHQKILPQINPARCVGPGSSPQCGHGMHPRCVQPKNALQELKLDGINGRYGVKNNDHMKSKTAGHTLICYGSGFVTFQETVPAHVHPGGEGEVKVDEPTVTVKLADMIDSAAAWLEISGMMGLAVDTETKQPTVLDSWYKRGDISSSTFMFSFLKTHVGGGPEFVVGLPRAQFLFDAEQAAKKNPKLADKHGCVACARANEMYFMVDSHAGVASQSNDFDLQPLTVIMDTGSGSNFVQPGMTDSIWDLMKNKYFKDNLWSQNDVTRTK